MAVTISTGRGISFASIPSAVSAAV